MTDWMEWVALEEVGLNYVAVRKEDAGWLHRDYRIPIQFREGRAFTRKWVGWVWNNIYIGSPEMPHFCRATTSEEIEALIVLRGLCDKHG